MSKEISFKKKGYAATFVIDNAPDCDVCQLYALDEKNKKATQMSTWLRSDFFLAYMKGTDEMISDLKAKIEEKDKVIYQNTLTIEDVRKVLNEKDETVTMNLQLIEQLENQNGRLIEERDNALTRMNESYVYCTEQHGKFKSANALFESYIKLEKEYTKARQELSKKEKLLNQYPYTNDVIEKQYEELKTAIDYLLTVEDKARYAYLSNLNRSIDVLCDKHKARIRDVENSISTIEKLEKQNDDYANDLTRVLSENESLATRLTEANKTNEQHIAELEKLRTLNEKYPFHYSEEYMADHKRLKSENIMLKNLNAKELGAALSTVFEELTDAIREKMNSTDLMDIARSYNQDQLHLLDNIRDTLEDILEHALKHGDVTWRCNDKILDYIDSKIEELKGITK